MFAISLGLVDPSGTSGSELLAVLQGDSSGLGVGDVAPCGAGLDALLHGALATDEALDKAGIVCFPAMVAKLLELGGEPGCVASLRVLSHGLPVAGWIARSGRGTCSQDVEPGSGVAKFHDGTGGRCEASVEGGVDRKDTVGATSEPPGSTRDVADRGVGGGAGTVSDDPVVLSDAGALTSVALSGKRYTPVPVGNGGRHADASRGAEVVARNESARVESLDGVSDSDDPRLGDAAAYSALGLPLDG